MGFLRWLLGKQDFSFHEKKRKHIQDVEARLKRINNAIKRENFNAVDKELLEWREEEEGK